MTPDVLVIGGGVIGLACAWRLADAGLRVTLLDRDQPGRGASGASLGALIPAVPTNRGPTQQLQRASLALFPDFAAELRGRTGIDVGYARCGLLDLMHHEQRYINAVKEVEAARAEWPPPDDAGPSMSLLSADAARALEPQVTFDPLGARYCRYSAQVDVAALLDALVAACRARNVEIRTGAAVTTLELDHAERFRAAMVAGERIPAGAALVAAGAWTSALHPLLAKCAPISPAKGQALLLQLEKPLFARILKRRTAYLIPRPGNFVLVGSTTEPEAGFSMRNTAAGIAALTAGALALVPALASASVVRTWAGPRPQPASRRPYLGAVPGTEGLYVAAGHYKTGIGHAPLTAALLTAAITARPLAHDLTPFAPAPTS